MSKIENIPRLGSGYTAALVEAPAVAEYLREIVDAWVPDGTLASGLIQAAEILEILSTPGAVAVELADIEREADCQATLFNVPTEQYPV